MLKLKVSGLLNLLEKVPPYGKQDEQVCGPRPPVGNRGPVISFQTHRLHIHHTRLSERKLCEPIRPDKARH